MRLRALAPVSAGTSAGAVVLIAMASAGGGDGGLGVGIGAVAALLAALGVGMAVALAMAGRRGAAIAAIGGTGAVVVAAMIAAGGRGARDVEVLPLLESDRAQLETIEEGEVRVAMHPTLGFVLPHPPIALVPSEAIATETAAAASPEWRAGHQLWAFETEDRSVTFVADLSRTEHASRDSLAGLLEAVTGPLGRAGHRVRAEDVVERERCVSQAARVELTSGGHVDARLFAWEDPLSHRAFHLAITVVSADEGWDTYLGLVAVPCD